MMLGCFLPLSIFINNLLSLMTKRFQSSQANSYQSVANDVHYELCNTYMRRTGDSLLNRELQLIMDTTSFLQTYAERSSRKARHQYWTDLSTTFESHTLDAILNEEEELPRIKPKLISRKSVNSSMMSNNLNRSTVESSLSNSLLDIRENCSRRTITAINNLVADYRKLEKRLMDRQIEGKGYRGRGSATSPQMQQNIKLSAKVTKLQKQNQYLGRKVKQLESKLAKQAIAPPSETESQVERRLLFDMRKQIEEKEISIRSIYEGMGSQHQSIKNAIQKQFIEEGCLRCCSLMKKIKQSLVGYRQCLEAAIHRHDQFCRKTQKLIDQYGK